MKYYYLFILIGFTDTHILSERSELNKEQGKQIESLIIHSQDGEKAVTNKANGLMVDSAYYIGKLYDETTPMVASNQFVMPVLKHGRKDKEDEYPNYIDASHLTNSV